MSANMVWSQGALTNVTFYDKYNMGMVWEHCSLSDYAVSTYYRLNVQRDRDALLTQAQLEEIWKRAEADAKNDSSYTANAIRQFLDYFKIDGYAVPQVFSYREEEAKVVKFMQKVCEKGKAAKDGDKELWKRYYTAYLRDVYVHEAETIAKKEKEERERQETIKDSIARNDWSKSSSWVALKDYCGKDYSLKDDAAEYGKFIEKYRLNLEKIYKECCGGRSSIIPEEFIKDSLFENYKTILTEINYSPIVPEPKGYFLYTNDKNREYHRLKDSVLYSFFLKENKMVDELRHLKEKFSEIDTSSQRKLWYVCNNYYFKERINNLKNNSTLTHTSNGVINDTITINNIMYISKIPYFVENGMLIPHGVCSVRLFRPQDKEATGSAFYHNTADVTMIVNVNNGKATRKSVTGTVCEWDVNTAAGKGKSYFGATQAIAAAKPIVKKRKTINGEEDILNSTWARDYDNMKIILTYGCTKTMWERIIRLKTNEEDYLKSIKKIEDIYAAYIYTGEELYLRMTQRPFIPIDFTDLQ